MYHHQSMMIAFVVATGCAQNAAVANLHATTMQVVQYIPGGSVKIKFNFKRNEPIENGW